MEGSQNQLNTSLNSFNGVSFDENLILNSVRSRKKISELPCCPVCSCTIRQNELQAHYLLEIERLTKLNCGGNKRKLSVNSSGSGLAVPGSSSEMPVEEEEVDVSGCTGGDVYQRVRSNRMRRLRSSRRLSPAPQTGDCPICNARLPYSRLQRHALRCLKRTGAGGDDIPDTSSEDGSIDVENDSPGGGGFGAEYQWCGEWRVRATSLMERGSIATPVRRVSNDTALVVDGDEDMELYGPPQYSPSRIAHAEAETEEQVTENGTSGYNSTETNNIQHDSSEHNMERVHEHIPESVRKNGVVEASAETRIQALKARIRDLEARQSAGNEVKCLICIEPYTSPAVSIQCWHVYCEVCWLESLRAKKICPQCNAITTTQHLRRIYM